MRDRPGPLSGTEGMIDTPINGAEHPYHNHYGDGPPPPNPSQYIEKLEGDLRHLRAEYEDMNRQLAIAEGAAAIDNQEAIREANGLRRLNAVLKNRLAATQLALNDANGKVKWYRRRIAEIEAKQREQGNE